MWVLLDRGDSAVVPSPSYPIHLVAPRLAGATVVHARFGDRRPADRDRGGRPRRAARAAGRDRLVPAQPDHRGRDARADAAAGRPGPGARVRARARLRLRGHRLRRPPSAVGARGRGRARLRRRAVQPDQVVLDGRLADGLHARPRRTSSPRSRSSSPTSTTGPSSRSRSPRSSPCARPPDYPEEVCEIYRSRRDALISGLARAGWDVQPPKGTMFVWAPIPEQHRDARVARVRAQARPRGRRRGQPGNRLRAGRRRTRPLRPDRERAADRPGDPFDPQAAAGLGGSQRSTR